MGDSISALEKAGLLFVDQGNPEWDFAVVNVKKNTVIVEVDPSLDVHIEKRKSTGGDLEIRIAHHCEDVVQITWSETNGCRVQDLH